MTSMDLVFIVGLINLICIIFVISKYKKRKRELERRLALIERHVVYLEKKLRKSINDANDATFFISKGLIELFAQNENNDSGDSNA